MANGTLKVSNIQTSSGSGTITLGQSGETVTVASGVTQTVAVNTPAFLAKPAVAATISDNTLTFNFNHLYVYSHIITYLRVPVTPIVNDNNRVTV